MYAHAFDAQARLDAAHFAGLPQELKERPQWVTWQMEHREGKPAKVPVNPKSGDFARTNDPDTWGEFAQAVEFWNDYRGSGVAGIGYVLSARDPYVGIDLDGCREPKTGEIESWAWEIIKRLNSYTEVSPSGRGVHIIAKGKLPPGPRRNGKVEMYDEARYFTMTGQHLGGTPTTIEERQAEVAALHAEIFGQESKEPIAGEPQALNLSDAELIAKAQQAANGEKFGKLWRGEWQEDYPSQSEATAALLSILVFWCGPDPDRIDRLFRQSGLMREKWDRPTFGSTWGVLQIRHAIAGATEFYRPDPGNAGRVAPLNEQVNRPTIISASQLLSMEFSEAEWVIGGGILPKGGGLILAGASGVGKSLMRTEIAIHLVMSLPIWGFEIPTPRRVLILQFENTPATEQKRLKSMLKGLGIAQADFPDNLMFSEPALRFNLGNDQDRKRIADMVRESGAEVVIYDPLTSLHNVNENDNVLMRQVLDSITEINRKTNSTAIVIHHFGKPHEYSMTGHRARGASSIRDWTDTLIEASRKRHEHKTIIQLDLVKVRTERDPKPLVLERDEHLLHHITEVDMLCSPGMVRSILEEMGGWAEGQEALKQAIMQETKCAERAARKYISQAVEHKAIIERVHPKDSRRKIYAVENSGTKK